MSASTPLMRGHRTLGREIMYRANWFFLGGLLLALIACIPVIGWLLAIGGAFTVLWKTFGFREIQTVGECPACTKGLSINPKKDDVISCGVCGHVIQVEPDRLVLVNFNR